MRTVTVYQAKTHLSRLLASVEDGEEVLIARGKTPIAKLTPLRAHSGKRRLGSAKGTIVIARDFDAPLEEFSDYT